MELYYKKKSIYIFTLTIVSIFFNVTHTAFTTLTQLELYAKKYPEYIQTDNQNLLDPDFSSFHKKEMPYWWQKITNALHITQPDWSAKKFKQSLETLIFSRELNGCTGRFVQKITPQLDTKFILWGDLHGAFHSLVRDLKTLSQMGAITTDLKVQPPYYFIFNGNLINRSPYDLETLSLIINCMIINPERVIYIMGSHENEQFWHNFYFARELQIRCAQFTDKSLYLEQQIPLDKEITRFFNTLPLALYLIQPDQNSDTINTVRISYFPRSFTEINEQNFAGFLAIPNKETIEQHNLEQKIISSKKVSIKAIIEGEDRATQFKPTKGLIVLTPDEDSTTWSLLSSPISAHRQEYNFFYDAFAQITVTDGINNWTIDLYNQDVRHMFGIKKSASYNLTTGLQLNSTEQQLLNKKIDSSPAAASVVAIPVVAAPVAAPVPVAAPTTPATAATPVVAPAATPIAAPTTPAPAAAPVVAPVAAPVVAPVAAPVVAPVAAPVVAPAAASIVAVPVVAEQKTNNVPSELVMGSAVGITGALGAAGKTFAAGIELRIQEARNNHELKNILPKIIIKDDEYDPYKTRAIMENFIQNNINIIIAPPGNATLASYYDLITAGKLLVLFPSTGEPKAHSSEFKYMLHYRGDDSFEGRVLLEYAITNLKAKNIILFIQHDEFGLALLKGAHETIQKYANTVTVTEVSYEKSELTFKNQIEKIRQIKQFDTIIFCCITSAAEKLVQQLGIEYLAGKNILGNSDFSGDEISTFFTNKGLTLTKLSVVPNVKTSTLPIVQQFKIAAQKVNILPDAFTLESYIATDIALELIRRVEPPITKEKIIAIAENIKNESYKGLPLNFNPEKRELGQPLWVNTGDPVWKTVKEVNGAIVIEN